MRGSLNGKFIGASGTTMGTCGTTMGTIGTTVGNCGTTHDVHGTISVGTATGDRMTGGNGTTPDPDSTMAVVDETEIVRLVLWGVSKRPFMKLVTQKMCH